MLQKKSNRIIQIMVINVKEMIRFYIATYLKFK